ncbi:MAG: T9SS type A sorting domain-containing protein [Phaeodactylibacter sp.]|nr:T9SS type A sorting domain-containing protein [Phaeodactylibacter sp.]
MHSISTLKTAATICLAACFALSASAQPCYDISGWDIPFDIAYDNDNNLMVTGHTDGGLLFLRTSLFGGTLAQAALPVGQHPDGYAMVEADEDTYIIGGADYLYGEPGENLPFLLKVDSMGNELWRRTFAAASELHPSPIARHIIRNAQEEAVYVATIDTVWMIGYDGATLAARSAEEMGLPFFYSTDMVKTEGGMAVLIFSNTILHFNERLEFLGVSEMSLDIRTIVSFFSTPGGGFLIVGQGHDLLWKVIKVDDQGTTEWERSYTLPNYSWGYPKDVDAYEDGFLLMGRLIKVIPPASCSVLLKIGADGAPEWLKEITECGSEFETIDAFAFHSESGLIHAVGRASCTPGNSNEDVFLVTTDTSPSIILSEEETTGQTAFELFPNPAKDEAHVILPGELPAGHWQLHLYNTAGQLALRRREAGNRFTFDTGTLQPGLYLLRVTDGLRVFSRRLVVE